MRLIAIIAAAFVATFAHAQQDHADRAAVAVWAFVAERECSGITLNYAAFPRMSDRERDRHMADAVRQFSTARGIDRDALCAKIRREAAAFGLVAADPEDDLDAYAIGSIMASFFVCDGFRMDFEKLQALLAERTAEDPGFEARAHNHAAGVGARMAGLKSSDRKSFTENCERAQAVAAGLNIER